MQREWRRLYAVTAPNGMHLLIWGRDPDHAIKVARDTGPVLATRGFAPGTPIFGRGTTARVASGSGITGAEGTWWPRESTPRERPAFGGYDIRGIDRLDESAHDRKVRIVMEAHGLTEYVRADGSSYPVVGEADRTPTWVTLECLDPYTRYQSRCQLMLATNGKTLSDGWQCHVTRPASV